jgi:hypothetical protein
MNDYKFFAKVFSQVRPPFKPGAGSELVEGHLLYCQHAQPQMRFDKLNANGNLRYLRQF